MECRHFLSNVTLQANVTDIWQWLPDITGGYTLRTCYQLLTTQDDTLLDGTENKIWHPQVPLKVSLAWRLLRDRLPTRNNLLTRGIISATDSNCVAECRQLESVEHLFLQCNIFAKVWQQVRFWIGVSGVDHYRLRDHFV